MKTENNLRSRAAHWGYSFRVATVNNVRHYRLLRKEVEVFTSADPDQIDAFMDQQIVDNVRKLPTSFKNNIYEALAQQNPAQLP